MKPLSKEQITRAAQAIRQKIAAGEISADTLDTIRQARKAEGSR